MDPFAAALDAAANAARGTKRPRQIGMPASQAQQEYPWSIPGEIPEDAWVSANRPCIAGYDGHQPGQHSGYGQSLAAHLYGEHGSYTQPHTPSQQPAGMQQPYSTTGAP
eukprot:COSAG03_NODE_7161_length_956_cov_1.404901_1_plen_108_part_10